ncbi:MAG: transposase [Firmicutes bacterium]|nr:transposase [Bacillota bacterium]
MCQVMQVSRSGYYAWLKRPESNRKAQDRELLKKIRKMYKASRGTYESPRITRALRKQDIICGENRVARLMRDNGICCNNRIKRRTLRVVLFR